MARCGDLPRKYFYLRAHSNVPDELVRIPPVENVTYINTIEADTLCWHNKHTRRMIEIFASYNPTEREHNLQEFMRNMRFQSTNPELRGAMFYPSRSPDATNQPFAFFHQSGEPLDSLPLGIWDLDELRERVTNLNRSTILDRPTPVFFQEQGFSRDSLTHILTLEQIRDILMQRYPGQCIVIIMGGCRLIQTSERIAIRSREERAPGELPINQLAEAFGHLRPPHQVSEESLSGDELDDSADMFRHRPEIARDPGMQWNREEYRGRDFNADITYGHDPLSNPAFPITSQPGRKREWSPFSPNRKGGRKTRKSKRGKSKRETRKGRKGKK